MAIRPRIRSGSPNQPTVGVRSLLDDLPTTEPTPRSPGQILNLVPQSSQLVNDIGRNSLLNEYLAGCGALVSHRLCVNAEPRSVQRSLHIKPTQYIQQNLNVSLRLHETSHDAKRHEEVIMTRDQGGDNRVVWSFTSLEGIRVSLLQHEAKTPTLKGKATSVRDGYINSFRPIPLSRPQTHIPPVPNPV